MRSWSLATRLFIAQLAVLVLVAGVALVGMFLHTRSTVHQLEGSTAVATARLAADDPEVAPAYRSADPRPTLQKVSDRVLADSGADFATFMTTEGVRLTYQRPGYVGTVYSGTIEPALRGERFVETSATATAGLSVRAVVPVMDGDRVVGVLTVGRSVSGLQVVAASQIPSALLVVAVLAVMLGLFGLLLARYLRRVTSGLGPEELARNFDVADAALHTVDEGIVLLDERGRILLHNRAASTLLGLPADTTELAQVEPKDLGLPQPITELLASGRQAVDEPHAVGTRLLVLNARDVHQRRTETRRHLPRFLSRRGSEARRPHRLLTVHDHSAVQALAGELASTRSLTDALRAQNHDHANRLHTLLSLLEVGRVEEARRMLLGSVGRGGTIDPGDGDVVLSALVRGKSAEASERGLSLEASLDLGGPTGLAPTDVVGIFGNLIDNAMDAAEAGSGGEEGRWVRVDVTVEEQPDAGVAWLMGSVADGGDGFGAGVAERIFAAGFSTKPSDAVGRGQGLAIVERTVTRLGGTVCAATDSGTVFTVEVPLPRSDDGSPAPLDAASGTPVGTPTGHAEGVSP